MFSLMFFATLFTIPKVTNPPKCPSIGDWIKKIRYVCTMEYYPAIKKRRDITICDNTGGPGGYYAK